MNGAKDILARYQQLLPAGFRFHEYCERDTLNLSRISSPILSLARIGAEVFGNPENDGSRLTYAESQALFVDRVKQELSPSGLSLFEFVFVMTNPPDRISGLLDAGNFHEGVTCELIATGKTVEVLAVAVVAASYYAACVGPLIKKQLLAKGKSNG